MTPRARKVAVFAAALALFGAAAAWRWPDSAHAIGVVRRGGGAARHAVVLEAGRDAYQVVATATVIPPYRGDVAVTLEGPPAEWDLELSHPVVDLGVRSWPRLEGRTLRGLAPRDRLALWVTLRPPAADPVCGMACGPGALRDADGGRCFCSEACRSAWRASPGPRPPPRTAAGRWALALRDLRSGEPVLTVPIVLAREGEASHGSGAHH